MSPPLLLPSTTLWYLHGMPLATRGRGTDGGAYPRRPGKSHVHLFSHQSGLSASRETRERKEEGAVRRKLLGRDRNLSELLLSLTAVEKVYVCVTESAEHFMASEPERVSFTSVPAGS